MADLVSEELKIQSLNRYMGHKVNLVTKEVLVKDNNNKFFLLLVNKLKIKTNLKVRHFCNNSNNKLTTKTTIKWLRQDNPNISTPYPMLINNNSNSHSRSHSLNKAKDRQYLKLLILYKE